MKQTRLIDQIIETLGQDTTVATNKWTHVDTKPLVEDEDSEGPQGAFSYSSAAGMLLYLPPNITYSLNCWMRYMVNIIIASQATL